MKLSPQRLSAIIKREREHRAEKWLALAKQDADLAKVSFSDAERKDHIPQLLNATIEVLEGGEQ